MKYVTVQEIFVNQSKLFQNLKEIEERRGAVNPWKLMEETDDVSDYLKKLYDKLNESEED